MIVASIVPLQALVLTLVALGGIAVVLTQDPLRQILVNGMFGLTLSLLFFVFQAPDVALSMLVVGAVAYPLIVLVAIARVRRKQGDGE